MSDTGKIEEILESLKSYATTNYELIKLQAVERVTVIMADLMGDILVGLVALLFVFFISLWASLYLSTLLGDNYSGFAIVAGFYLLIGITLLVFRKRMVIKPIRNKIIREIFNSKQ
jgi:hypothetical protein